MPRKVEVSQTDLAVIFLHHAESKKSLFIITASNRRAHREERKPCLGVRNGNNEQPGSLGADSWPHAACVFWAVTELWDTRRMMDTSVSEGDLLPGREHRDSPVLVQHYASASERGREEPGHCANGVPPWRKHSEGANVGPLPHLFLPEPPSLALAPLRRTSAVSSRH